jgi:hypothetical protein
MGLDQVIPLQETLQPFFMTPPEVQTLHTGSHQHISMGMDMSNGDANTRQYGNGNGEVTLGGLSEFDTSWWLSGGQDLQESGEMGGNNVDMSAPQGGSGNDVDAFGLNLGAGMWPPTFRRVMGGLFDPVQEGESAGNEW